MFQNFQFLRTLRDVQLECEVAYKESEKVLRQVSSLGFCMKFKTLFMSDEEIRGQPFDLPLFFNMSKQLLAPVGLQAECVQVSIM